MAAAREIARGVASVLAIAAFTLGVGVLAVYLGLAPLWPPPASMS